MKEYWCEAPAHLQSLPIELWRNISQTEDGCQVFDYPWNTVTAADISVGLLNFNHPFIHNSQHNPLFSFTCNSSRALLSRPR